MNAALPLAPADDPRLGPLVTAALRHARIDPEWADTVHKLATGGMSPRSLNCCGSGCRPCVQDILRCTVSTLRAYHDPGEEERLVGGDGLRSRARRLAERAVKRVWRRTR